MNNLLDTHAFIWYFTGNNKLSAKALQTIDTSNSTNFISIVSLWEIAIKKSLNKIDFDISFEDLEKTIDKYKIRILPITYLDTLLVSKMPFHHNDPFDRIIIAQAQNNNFNLISTDKHFSSYNVNLIW